jgi:leucyl-tRNA synthetase
MPVRGEPECLLELTGQDLMGVPLSAPNCPHERIYVLPLLTILTNKVRMGVGIVILLLHACEDCRGRLSSANS